MKKIQSRLRELGLQPGPVDGAFGPRTARAVRKFQAARGLPAVGYVGPRTYEALFAAQPARPAAAQPAAAERKQAAGRADPPASPRTRLPLPDPEPAGAAGQGGRLALTFDDGPDPAVLPAILESLERRGVKATFFVEGSKAARHPDLLRRMARGGHEVENHAFTHRSLAGRRPGEIEREIRETAEVVRRTTGRSTRYLRPPAGALDDAVAAAARRAGHRVVLWTNIGAADVPFPGRERLVADVLAAAYDGAVIMLHADRRETADALPALLDALKGKGFRLVRLDELVR